MEWRPEPGSSWAGLNSKHAVPESFSCVRAANRKASPWSDRYERLRQNIETGGILRPRQQKHKDVATPDADFETTIFEEIGRSSPTGSLALHLGEKESYSSTVKRTPRSFHCRVQPCPLAVQIESDTVTRRSRKPTRRRRKIDYGKLISRAVWLNGTNSRRSLRARCDLQK